MFVTKTEQQNVWSKQTFICMIQYICVIRVFYKCSLVIILPKDFQYFTNQYHTPQNSLPTHF